jgi:hypothetical protein
MVAHTCYSGVKDRKYHGSKSAQAKNARLYLINKAKKAGRVAQMVECLPSKHEALSSNSTTEKKKKEFLPYRIIITKI